MKLKKLRFVSAQPATLYYVWQVEVMLNNFIEMGINLNNVDIVCAKQNGIIPDEWSKLASNYPSRFFFYDDLREEKNYVSSIRPNILKQHFMVHPYLKNEIIFYHDCDILFTKPIWETITNEMLIDDVWYGSDTRWYIGHDYILSKGEDILDEMCKIVGIDKSIIKNNELNCIGAQYLLKNIDFNYWNRVEKDSEKLFKQITELNEQKVIEDRRTMPPGEERTPYHPLQIWCADMWAVLWNGWKMGCKTECHPNFNFSWATSSIDEYYEMNIMHNAGVVDSNGGLFYKANYMNILPYNEILNINKDRASYVYWQNVCETAKKSVLL